MKIVLVMLIGIMTLSACDRTPPAPDAAPAPTVLVPEAASSSTPVIAAPMGMARYNGYGDMRFGMDEPTFRHAWQGDLTGKASADGGCYYLTPKWVKSAKDFGFMFEQGHFVRYDVGNTREEAPGGGKVGMTIAQIQALYGDRVEQTPHKYEQGAFYLRIANAHDGVLLFEADAQGKVTRWRVGMPPQIDYVEGCG